MVTSRTVSIAMRRMAIKQSQSLRKDTPMLQSVSKAAVAFLALVITNLLAQLTATGFAYPTSLSGWLTLGVTTVVGTFGVWLKSNFTTDQTVATEQSVRLKPAEAA